MNTWKSAIARPMLLAVLLFVVPGLAAAETYVGASYGTADGENADFEDSTANGWRAFLGASAGGVFGWEVGYGEISEFRGRTLGRVDISGVDGSFLVGLPAGPLVFFGKVGAVFATVDTDNRDSSDDWTYKYGVGVDANMGKTFALRFEWTRYAINSDIIDSDVDVASAGVLFRF